MSRLVVIESPYKADTPEELERNIQYARRCMKDCFERGEFPFASHLLYIQPGILDDNKPHERKLGIEAGLAWTRYAHATVVYTDLGISEGMKRGITRGQEERRFIEYRSLDDSKSFVQL